MNSSWTSLKSHLPPMRTPRQRLAVAGGALLLFAGIAWGLWALLAPAKDDASRTWFSQEFRTNNAAHPLDLAIPGVDQGEMDLLAVENLSSEPLSILPFSSRPRPFLLTGRQIMSAWAQWIATSRQGIIVEPHSTWVLSPGDTGRLPAVHGHTWITIFFSAEPPAPSGLPAAVLPPGFAGRFRVRYCLSRLPDAYVALPQVHRQEITRLLQDELDAGGKAVQPLSPCDLSNRNDLTPTELR
ncbi:MAG: hypothetical protein ACP5VF_13665 [Acidobacteriota bacterium]